MSARGPVLDRFRLLAAVLVVCIHTGPLAGCNAAADFWLCRVFARIAVPFFLMVSGYFLEKDQWRGAERFLKKTLAIYAAAVLLYLPLNLYGGGYSLPEWGKRLFLDGTLYHLWYFPAVLLEPLPAGASGRPDRRRRAVPPWPGRGQLLWAGFPVLRPQSFLRRDISPLPIHPERAVLRPAVSPFGCRRDALAGPEGLGGLSSLPGSHDCRGLRPPLPGLAEA